MARKATTTTTTTTVPAEVTAILEEQSQREAKRHASPIKTTIGDAFRATSRAFESVDMILEIANNNLRNEVYASRKEFYDELMALYAGGA